VEVAVDIYNLNQMWGAVVFRGVLSILFGIAAVFWPGITLVTIVYLFASYVLVNGIMNEIVGLTNMGGAADSFWGRLLLVLLGLLEIGVGVYLLRHPLVTFSTLILLIGLTFIVRALFELFAGIFGDGSATFRVVMILGGVLSGLVGILMLFQPVASGVAFVWILGLYALISGPLLVALGYEAKNAVRVVPARSARAAR
jgi:uncharacterized membrane protein HdeD (DUF308 family)